MQKPDGVLFPDKANLYMVAIEDKKYKDEKIHCVLTKIVRNNRHQHSCIRNRSL